MVNGRKLVGSAQRQMDDMLLQHGSVLVGSAHLRIVEAMPLDPEVRARVRQDLRSSTICLDELVQGMTFEELAGGLREGVEDRLGVRVEEEEASPEEYAEAGRLRAEKYGTERWNFPEGPNRWID